jgi:hypothetical protein
LATIPSNQDREDEELQAQMEGLAPQMPGAGPVIGGGLQTGQSWSSASNSNRAPQRQQIGFIDLGRYSAANRGATDALGSKVEGQITGAGQAARGALQQGQQQFGNLVNQAEVRDEGLINQIGLDPTRITADAQKKAQLARQRDAVYRGPQSLEETESYGGIAKSIADARDVGELAKTSSGVTQLANKAVQGSRTRGGAALDTNLLLGDQGLRGRLDTARAGLDTLDSELRGASQSAQERAKQAQQTTAQTRENTRGALVSAQDALQKALDERVQQKRLEAFYGAVTAQNALRGYLDAPLKGIDTATIDHANAGTQIKRDDPNVTPDQLDPELHKLTPQDIAALQALSPADQQRLMRARADQRIAQATKGLPTAGVAGRHYDNNDPTKGGFKDAAIAGNAPEFIHGGSGQAALPGFEKYLQTHQAAKAPTPDVLRNLGLSDEDWRNFAPTTPLAELARAAATGTNNVNPYSFLEQFGGEVGDLSRFINVDNPNVTIDRGNTASAADYDRAGALNELAAEFGVDILDQGQRGRAGTANTDIVDFDVRGAEAARNAAYDKLLDRVGTHIQGNARSGGDSFLKKYGVSIATGGLMPAGSSLKDLGKTLVPGTDQFKHIVDPRTPMMLPGGVAGLPIRTPGTDFGPYNDFTKAKAAEMTAGPDVDGVLDELRRNL